jgi:hypothetical protein
MNPHFPTNNGEPQMENGIEAMPIANLFNDGSV